MNEPTPPSPVISLRQALAQAREVLERQAPPAEMQAAILSRQARQRQRAAPALGRWTWAAALAGILLLASPFLHWNRLPQHQPVPTEPVAGFLPLVPQEQWPQADAAAWLVRAELRRDRLAALGLPCDPARAGESVQAELLVRPTGEVLAVRFPL